MGLNINSMSSRNFNICTIQKGRGGHHRLEIPLKEITNSVRQCVCECIERGCD